jgi:hypothetical protein
LKVYGPYTRKDGRKIVNIVYDNQRRKTVSYPKYLLGQHLGRELLPHETVDHIDRDFTNDSIDNLQVLTQKEHTALDTRRVDKVEIICIECGKVMKRDARRVRANSKQGKAGPFCKSCAGRYGASIQNNAIKRLPAQPAVESRYYWLDKTKT